jgi:predicted small lipoprotein YifL
LDAYQVPVRRLISRAVVLASLAALAGCGPRPVVEREAPRRPDKKSVKAAEDKSTISFTGLGNDFKVNDKDGKRLLEAKVEKMEGSAIPGKGFNGPVLMHKAKCLLYQRGKPQMHLEAPEATWDGKRLVAQKTAHGVSADAKNVIDAQTAVWTAAGGGLDLVTARLQSLKEGKLDFTAEGPKAQVQEQVVTMPAGAVGHNAQGQQLTANHVRWNLKTEKLEANGNVVVSEEGTRVSGQRLLSDTRLKRGRLIGGTRVRTQKAFVAKKKK